MKIRQLLLLFLTLTAVGGLTSCGGGSDENPSPATAYSIKKAQGFNSTGQPFMVLDSMFYVGKPPGALHDRGFKRTYVWPNRGPGDPAWEYSHDPKLLETLDENDESSLREVVRTLCNNLLHPTETTYVVFDIEWPMPLYVAGRDEGTGPEDAAQREINFENLTLIAKWASSEFRSGPCANRVKFSLYNTPLSPAWTQNRNIRFSASEEVAYYNLNARFLAAIGDYIDFTAPVFYFNWSTYLCDPTGWCSDERISFFDFWVSTVNFLSQASRTWNKPTLPFVGIRWFTYDDPGLVNKLIDPATFSQSLGVLADSSLGLSGIILWDCDCLADENDPNDTSGVWNLASGWFPAVKSQFGLGMPDIGYGGSPSPGLIDWSAQTVGTTPGSDEFTLTNGGKVPISGVTIAVTDGWQIYDNNCSDTLNANGGSCGYKVRFLPTEPRAYTGSLTITLADGSRITKALIGEGVNAASVTGATFSQTSLSAGNAGTFSWTTTNAVSATVSCSGAGASASGQGLSGSINVPTSLQGPLNCTVTAKNLLNTIATRSESLPVHSLMISFEGIDNLPALDWTKQTIGSPYTPPALIVTNISVAAVAAPTIAAPAPWSVFSTTCHGTLAANGGSCQVRLKFDPSAVGSYSAMLSISGSSTAPPLALLGEGINAPVVTSASFVQPSLSAGSSGTFNWSTANSSNASVSCSGAGANASGQGLSGNISVPTNMQGPLLCTVVATNAANASVSVGRSVAVHALRISFEGINNLPSLDWAQQTIGSPYTPPPLVFTNISSAPVAAPTFTAPAPWSVFSTTCSGTLGASGGSCEVRLKFDPLVAGSYSAVLGISGSATAPPLMLLGKGVH